MAILDMRRLSHFLAKTDEGAKAPSADAPPAASVAELEALLRGTPGLESLTYTFGSTARCFGCYLRSDAVRFDVAKAAERIRSTLAFRAENKLDDIADAGAALASDRCKPLWPSAYADWTAPDGSVVQYSRLGGLKLHEIKVIRPGPNPGLQLPSPILSSIPISTEAHDVM